MVADFETSHPDIKVSANWIQNDYEQQLQTTIAGGTAPTVSQISNTSLASFASTYQPVNLTPSTYSSPNIAASAKFDGKYYETPFTAKAKVMVINKKLFEKNGVPLPSATTPLTPDQFAADAKKLTSGSGKTKIYGSSPLWYLGWLTAEGGSEYNEAGTKCTFDSDAAVRAARLVGDSQAEDGFAPTLLDAQGQDMFGWLSIGRIAMYPDFGPWNIAQLTALKNSSDFEIVPVPGKGEPMEIDGLGISKTASASQTAAAKTFVKFMSTNKAAQSLLTTSKASLGQPVVDSARDSFLASAPSMNLQAFLSGVDQSTVPASVKQATVIESKFTTDLASRTAVGSGKEDPAKVLPELNSDCQSALSSN
ncbi:extracellular solute-binding protein [Frondihabitans sp. PAMC 28766]|uniref:extracellular solute-binding protein n=1 Tax=Frondihabitans sp. PAMC 28766 TaxID=1795630 RepID=UPI0012FF931C|nr:extracellular solute-binding protein [Frondihabitans sp. PAMC 28766]